jgi:hypothetical protein
MRPNARGLAQHCGPPGWLEDSEPTGVILYVMQRWLSQELPSCKLMEFPAAVLDSKCTQLTSIRHELRHARKARLGTLVDPCLLSDCEAQFAWGRIETKQKGDALCSVPTPHPPSLTLILHSIIPHYKSFPRLCRPLLSISF